MQQRLFILGGVEVAKKNKKDKNIAPSLIWLCLGCSGYVIYKNWIFLAVGLMLSGVLYIRNN